MQTKRKIDKNPYYIVLLRMKGKNIVFFTTAVILVCTSAALSQIKVQPKPKVTPQPNFINNRLEDIDKRLAIVEGKQESLPGSIGLAISVAGFYIAITGAFLTVLAGGSITIVVLRRFVLRDLYESVRKDFDKEIKNLRKNFTTEINLFKEEVKRKIDDSQQLVNLVQKHLDIGLDDEEQVKDLKTKIKMSSSTLQDNIFTIALDFQRSTFFQNNGFEKVIGRLIPIYEGIIESDNSIEGQEEFFRSRANLSYVYNYKEFPNLIYAKNLIDEAIRIRTQNKKIVHTLYFYEFMRAIYLMKMYSEATQTPKIVSQISDDLRVSSRLFYTAKSLVKDAADSAKFDQKNHRRYIIESEFDLIKTWLKQHPEVTSSLSLLNEE